MINSETLATSQVKSEMRSHIMLISGTSNTWLSARLFKGQISEGLILENYLI